MKDVLNSTEFNLLSEPKKEKATLSFYEKLGRVSLSIVTIFLLLQFALILTQNINDKVKKKMVKWNGGLPGMYKRPKDLFGAERNEPNSKPIWTFTEMLSGRWQKKFESWYNTQMIPLRSKLIKFHNQIYYTFFLKSYMLSGDVAIGKDRNLYLLRTIKRYHNFSRSPLSQETLDTWTDELQTLKNFFQKRGQTFIYIVTPSKAGSQPEGLLDCKQCDPAQARQDYLRLTETLRKRGFEFVDAANITDQAKKTFTPTHLFPKGGFHWTSLAGALATRQLMSEISKNHPLPPLQFSYRLDAKPRNIDIDLASFLNVYATPKHYLVPEVFVKPHQRKNKKPLKMAIISGSFMFEVAKILAETKLFDQIDFFFYWGREHYRNTPLTKSNAGTLTETFMPFDALGIRRNQPGAHAEILSADIVILEENEANIPSKHRKALMDKVFEKKS